MSPVCRMKAGGTGRALILSIAAFKGTYDIGIRSLVKSHVAVTNLDEGKVALGCMFFELGKATQAVGGEHPAFDDAKGACPGPCHALQKATAVNSVVVVVV